jgi:hypothetical protein
VMFASKAAVSFWSLWCFLPSDAVPLPSGIDSVPQPNWSQCAGVFFRRWRSEWWHEKLPLLRTFSDPSPVFIPWLMFLIPSGVFWVTLQRQYFCGTNAAAFLSHVYVVHLSGWLLHVGVVNYFLKYEIS